MNPSKNKSIGRPPAPMTQPPGCGKLTFPYLASSGPTNITQVLNLSATFGSKVVFETLDVFIETSWLFLLISAPKSVNKSKDFSTPSIKGKLLIVIVSLDKRETGSII